MISLRSQVVFWVAYSSIARLSTKAAVKTPSLRFAKATQRKRRVSVARHHTTLNFQIFDLPVKLGSGFTSKKVRLSLFFGRTEGRNCCDSKMFLRPPAVPDCGRSHACASERRRSTHGPGFLLADAPCHSVRCFLSFFSRIIRVLRGEACVPRWLFLNLSNSDAPSANQSINRSLRIPYLTPHVFCVSVADRDTANALLRCSRA